ncbi:Probable inactive receptor kinase At2g26730 [Linum perenne]
MNPLPISLLFLISFLFLHSISAVEDGVMKHSLISFLAKLNGSTTGIPDPSFGWVESTHPCIWPGISCDASNKSITRITISGLQLSGVFDPASICSVGSLVSSLTLINLQRNQINGQVPDQISNCTSLTQLLLGKNNFSGRIPNSFANLKNLNKLDLSHNDFSGNLPDLTRLSGLMVFTAQGNHFTGPVPSFDFLKLHKFDVSHNNFSGHIPDVKGKFSQGSFQDNPQLCGSPLPKPCLSSNIVSADSESRQVDDKKTKGMERNQILMYSGYTVVGFGLISFIAFWICKRKSCGDGMTKRKGDLESRVASVDDSFVTKESSLSQSRSSHVKDSRSEEQYSTTGESGGLASSSLVVLTSPVVNGLDFEELLKAPAELLGRGRHGSLYKT